MPYSDEERLIECGQCHGLIGYYVTVGNQTWLQVAGLKLQSAHGICARCGEPYHFAATDKMLDELLGRCR